MIPDPYWDCGVCVGVGTCPCAVFKIQCQVFGILKMACVWCMCGAPPVPYACFESGLPGVWIQEEFHS